MPRLKTAAKIEVELDGQDLAWLRDKGYPFGVDAAGYLRMMVRQARLAPSPAGRAVVITHPQPWNQTPKPPLLEAMEGGADEAEAAGGVVDLDKFTDGVIGQAEEQGMIAPAPAEGQGGGVVLIGERRNRPAKEWA